MILFHAKRDGTVTTTPNFVPQGSSMQDLVVVSEFDYAYCAIKLLPASGEYIEDVPCTPILQRDFSTIFTAALTPKATVVAGSVDYRLIFTAADGTTQTTLAGSFTVPRGVPAATPPTVGEMSAKTIGDLYAILSSLYVAYVGHEKDIYQSLTDIAALKKTVSSAGYVTIPVTQWEDGTPTIAEFTLDGFGAGMTAMLIPADSNTQTAAREARLSAYPVAFPIDSDTQTVEIIRANADKAPDIPLRFAYLILKTADTSVAPSVAIIGVDAYGEGGGGTASGVDETAVKAIITAMLGNVANERQYSAANPPPYPVTTVNGKTGAVNLNASDVGARPSTWTPTAADVGADPAGTAESKTTALREEVNNTFKGYDNSAAVNRKIGEHNVSNIAHEDIRQLISDLCQEVNKFLNVDDSTRDELSEVLGLIDANAGTLESLLVSKVNKTDIINNLVTNDSNKLLSAAQGVALKLLIDNLAGIVEGKVTAEQMSAAVAQALTDAKESGDFDGRRGYAILRVTTATTSSSGTGDKGEAIKYKIPLSTVCAEAGVDAVYVGDTVFRASVYTYPVVKVDANYVYLGAYTSTKGNPGTSVSVASVTESAESGGENVVTFSDGDKLVVKNGKDGKTPVKGVDFDDGKDGKSAYDLYREEGGALTKAQWLASLAQGSPLFAEEIPADADTSKLYVLPDSHIWAYFGKSVTSNENLFDPNSTHTRANARISNGWVTTNAKGQLTTNFIPYDYSDLSAKGISDKFVVKIEGLNAGLKALHFVNGFNTFLYYYDKITDNPAESIGWSYIKVDGSVKITATEDADGNVYVDPTVSAMWGKQPNWANVKYIRFGINPNDDKTTSLTSEDYKDIKIYLVANETTEVVEGWYDTGLTYVPSECEVDLAAMQNSINDHELRIKDLKAYIGSGGSGSAIPAYWEDAIIEAETKIQALQDEGGVNCASFVWASDTHSGGVTAASGSNAVSTNVGRLASRLMADLNIPFFVVTGDLAADVGYGDDFPSKDDVDEFFKRIVVPVGADKVLAVPGNHDGIHYSASGDCAVSKAVRHNWFIRPFGSDRDRVWGNGGFFADDTQGRVRYIGLDACNSDYTVDDKGTPTPNFSRNPTYTANQLKWLAEEALDAPNGYTVVIATHYPSNGDVGSTPANSDALFAILTALRNKTAYSATVDGVAISKDYSNSGATMCAIFAGHIHEDSINTTHGYPIITIDTCGNTTMSDKTFVNASDQETGFDVVTINKATRTIHITRLGVGEDRTSTY